MHTQRPPHAYAGGEEGTYTGASLHRVPTLLPPQCSFCGWSPKSIQSLPATTQKILNLDNPQKTYRIFLPQKGLNKNTIHRHFRYPTARGFPNLNGYKTTFNQGLRHGSGTGSILGNTSHTTAGAGKNGMFVSHEKLYTIYIIHNKDLETIGNM